MNRENFLVSLLNVSDGIRKAHKAMIEDWRPEDPPPTTLYAALGYQIVDDFLGYHSEARGRIFSLVEQAMESEDEDLGEVVATGLIEALVTRAMETEGLWEQIKPLLGPQSLYHAEAWLSFDSGS